MKKKKLITIIAIVVNLFFSKNITYANNQVKITELLPNPIGSDSGNEWVELFNNSTQSINLNGWKIKSSAKTTTLKPLELKQYSYVTIPIQLKNTSNTVILMTPEGAINTQVQYDEAKEGQSYANTNGKWMWVDPTKSKQNEKIIELEGIIKTAPQIGKDFYFTLDQQKIIFEEMDFEFNFMKVSLKEGDQIKALVTEDDFKLKEFTVISKAPTQIKVKPKNKRIYLIPPLLSLLIALIIIIKRAPS